MEPVAQTPERPVRRAKTRTPLKPIAVPVDEACQIGGFGRTKAYELIGVGKLKTVAVGRRRLVIFASLEALLSPEAA